ncbi:MAG TPA: ScyD/ScyE family protein, partial [Solirubrobacteraceae bacterium]
MRTPALRCLAVTIVLLGCLISLSAASASPRPALKVIASGLNQPKKLTIAPNGDLVVALSGDGRAPSSCTDGDQRSCIGRSGAVEEVSPTGRVRKLLAGLPSISSGPSDPQATGPVEARIIDHQLHVLFQNTLINAKTGREIYGAAGLLLDELVRFSSAGTPSDIEARLGPFEARHDPDHGAGTDVAYGDDFAIDSDPYSFVPYRGGYAVADAGANDLLFISRAGKVSVLAVFPTIREYASAGTYGTSQKKAIEAEAQAVPTSVAVGPDGALYVGELGGVPYEPGTSDVYRV